MTKTKFQSYINYIVLFLIVIFIILNKFVGWDGIGAKDALPKYADKDYSTKELEKEWQETPSDKKAEFSILKIKLYLKDTLTDPEEAKIEYLVRYTLTDTIDFKIFADQLFEKKEGEYSILQQLYIRVDEEFHRYDEENSNLLNHGNRISSFAVFKSLFQNSNRTHDFLKQVIMQYGEWSNKGKFSLQENEINQNMQQMFRAWIILHKSNKTAEERFTKEEIETLRKLFKPVKYNRKGGIVCGDVREYLGI